MENDSPRAKGADSNPEARLRADFERAGQGHVFRFWDDLDRGERSDLLEQLSSVDLSFCPELPDLLDRDDRLAPDAEIGALPTVPLPRTEADRDRRAEARRAGEAALRSGRIGAFLAAGGQGSRLGFEGPKGTYPIGPVTDRSLFRLFTETILAHGRRWGAPVPLTVMTSPENHEETAAFFRERGRFGLPEKHLRFATQGMFPALTEGGKI
ncbi:MAG: UTP--glucose-1-phosphate uridylyltransferase, partial [Planctomycetota bacterium]